MRAAIADQFPRPALSPPAPHVTDMRAADLAARDRRIAARCAFVGLGLFGAILFASGLFRSDLASFPVVVGLLALASLCAAAPKAGALARQGGLIQRLGIGAAYGLACLVVPSAAVGLSIGLAGLALGASVEQSLGALASVVAGMDRLGALPAIALGVVFAASARR